jgi:hypothetical protein
MNKLSNTDFLTVLNLIGNRDTTSKSKYKYLKALDEPLTTTGLDSLDIMMFYVMLDEFFGIPNKVIDESVPDSKETCSNIFKFVKQHQTKGFTLAEVNETFKHYSWAT